MLTDAERLCNIHIPAWFAEASVDASRIARFYADPQKVKVDASSAAKAERDRLMSLSTELPWRARRLVALAKSRLHAVLARHGARALTLRPEGTTALRTVPREIAIAGH